MGWLLVGMATGEARQEEGIVMVGLMLGGEGGASCCLACFCDADEMDRKKIGSPVGFPMPFYLRTLQPFYSGERRVRVAF